METIASLGKALLLVLAMLCAEKSNADKSASSSAKEAEADQDVMMIITKAPRNATLPLENVKRRNVGTRSFLVGAIVDPFGTNSHLTAMVGKTVWVSTEEIGMAYVFESVEEMRKSLNPPVPAAPTATPAADGKKYRPRTYYTPDGIPHTYYEPVDVYQTPPPVNLAGQRDRYYPVPSTSPPSPPPQGDRYYPPSTSPPSPPPQGE